jgi:hypothetical protein
MFALWPMGRYSDIMWGQNHKILLKNRQILEKIYNNFIFTSILNPSESPYDKCHRLSFLVFCVLFVILGQKQQIFFFFLQKSVKLLPVNIRPLNHQ